MRILFLESSLVWVYALPYGLIDNGHQVMISGPLTEKNIPHMIKQFNPDLIVLIGWGVENTITKQRWIEKYVHEAKVPLVYWAVEDPAFIDEWSLKLIENIKPDFVFTISQSSVEYYKAKGIRAGYMDFGYHPSIYYPTEPNPKYHCAIAVVANAYPHLLDNHPEHFRRISLETLIAPLLKENIRIDFWGRDWDKMRPYFGVDIPKEWIHGYMPYKSANDVYNSADIIIGLQNYTSQVTQRTYEILGAGGFLVTQNTPGVNSLFRAGQDLITIDSPNEIVEVIRYYLVHPEQRMAIKKQEGLAIRQHSYTQRAKEMIEVLIKEGIVQEDSTISKQKGELYYYENYTEDRYVLYIVNPGDTLYGISNKFKVPLNRIIDLNNLESEEILVDQVLKISEKADRSLQEVTVLEELASNSGIGNTEVTRWGKYIAEASEKYQIPESILYGIMITESGGNPNLVSRTGGIGLMQFQIETANLLGINPCDPIQSIDGAACYLRKLYDQFQEWKLAVAAYTIGPDKVKAYNGIPPIEQSQNYVKKVFDISEAFQLGNREFKC